MKQRLAFPKPKDMPRRRVEAVQTMLDGREVCDLRTRAGMAEYKLRTLKMWQRQNQRCPRCRRLIPWEKASFDHEVPRGNGGALRDDRIEIRVAVAWDADGNVTEEMVVWQNQCLHLWCNVMKGSVREMPMHPRPLIFTGAITVDRNLQSPETPDSDIPSEGVNDEKDACSSNDGNDSDERGMCAERECAGTDADPDGGDAA